LKNGPIPRRSDLWINLALGVGAIKALGASGVINLDDNDGSFAGGMNPGLVGDSFAAFLPDGRPNPAHQSNWKVGCLAHPVDLMLIFANDGDITSQAVSIVNEVAALVGSAPTYSEVGQKLPGEIEHFGFRDGISQPGIRGRVIHKGVERFVTTRYGTPSLQGVDFGKPGQPLVWPGQFLTGQPISADDSPKLPKELTNGSFSSFGDSSKMLKLFLMTQISSRQPWPQQWINRSLAAISAPGSWDGSLWWRAHAPRTGASATRTSD